MANNKVGYTQIWSSTAEITALQIFYEQPYGQRHLTLEQVQELAEAIKKPPLELTPEALWQAYARLEKHKVKGAGEQRLLTDVITLVRYALGEDDELYPFCLRTWRRASMSS